MRSISRGISPNHTTSGRIEACPQDAQSVSMERSSFHGALTPHAAHSALSNSPCM